MASFEAIDDAPSSPSVKVSNLSLARELPSFLSRVLLLNWKCLSSCQVRTIENIQKNQNKADIYADFACARRSVSP